MYRAGLPRPAAANSCQWKARFQVVLFANPAASHFACHLGHRQREGAQYERFTAQQEVEARVLGVAGVFAAAVYNGEATGRPLRFYCGTYPGVYPGDPDQACDGPATKEENDEDLEKALIAKSGLSREVSGTRWCCPRCNKYKNLNCVKFCSGCGHPCTYDMRDRAQVAGRRQHVGAERVVAGPKFGPVDLLACQQTLEEREEYVPDEEWDPDAWDAVPPPKWVQEEAGVPRAAERCMYMHLCALDKVKKSYLEIECRVFEAPPGEIFGVKLHPDTVLVEVEEICGNVNLSPTFRIGPDTNASVNGKIKQVLQENWTGTPAANSKIFTTSIGMERLGEKFHEQGKRCMMLFNISAWLRPNLIEHRQSWVNVCYYGEIVAWAGLKRDNKREDIEKRCKMNLRKWMASRPSPALTPRLNRTKSDAQWKQCYVVEYLRPCLPDEVPTDVDAEVSAYVEQATSAAWRSHDQANVMCPQNVLHHPRERLQRVLYTPSSKHSSSCSIAKKGKHKIITHHDVKFGKRMWHMVHFWGNDYSKANSLPPNPPLFFPCFESVNDRVNGNPRLLFTNAREKKVSYTGKVQDRDL
eukprot:g26232.t1